MPCIETEKLSYVYFPGTPLEVTALLDIDLRIEDGIFFALVGASGSGKSTLVQHFNGLLIPTKGTVKVFSRDTKDKAYRQQLWRRVGLVFQYPERQIFGDTIYEDIAFGLRNMGMDDKIVRELVNEALAIAGLPENIQSREPRTLSGGMLRRVAICGVLAMRPKLLILDEPGAGLEPRARRLILARIKEWQLRHGATVILITHHLEDAAIFADEAAVLHQGKVLTSGTVRDVLGQISILEQSGLSPPFTVELASRLEEAGFKMPYLPLTIEEAAQILCAMRGDL